MTEAINNLAKYGRSFRLAGRLLPVAILNHAAELYTFCRAVDDLADETPDRTIAQHDLLALRAAILARDPSHRLAVPLLTLHRSHGVSLTAAVTLIDTVLQDLGPVLLADETAVLNYAYGAAGTVGMMMCAILDVSDKMATPYAIDLGIAMQLTNIARDVSADAASGRVYLPASWLPPGLGAAQLGAYPSEVFAAVGRLLDLAADRYRNAARGYQYLPPRVRPAIRAAGQIYEEIGLGILRRGPAYLTAERYVVPMPRKLMLMAGCLVPDWRIRRAGPAPTATPDVAGFGT